METKKKIIYSRQVSEARQNTGGTKKVFRIYKITGGKLVYIGEVKYNTASYKGHDSEVYSLLKDKKMVSTKEWAANRGYHSSRTSKFLIQDI